MPELPEVEATRQNLARWTLGARVRAVDVLDAALDRGLAALVGDTFMAWQRRGKALAGVTDRRVVYAHLGMTGHWVQDAAPRPYERLALTLAKGRKTERVAYVDARKLGDVKLVASVDDIFARLGPDAWDTPLSSSALAAAMGTGDKATLKERLMEQKRIAGVGNIAAIEACFRARVHPHTPVGRVARAQWQRLVPALRAHLEATLADALAPAAQGGELVYVSEGGDNPFLVYGRKGEACPVCGGGIAREVLAGRPTYLCPRCQRLPKPKPAS